MKRAVWSVEGICLSPVHKVTLEPSEREQALISADATHYAFAYPLDDEDQVRQPASHRRPRGDWQWRLLPASFR